MRPPAHPRWLNRLWSWLGGWFWSPCPLCGRHFGGHEWRDIRGQTSVIPAGTPGISTAICPWCTRAGRGTAALVIGAMW